MREYHYEYNRACPYKGGTLDERKQCDLSLLSIHTLRMWRMRHFGHWRSIRIRTSTATSALDLIRVLHQVRQPKRIVLHVIIVHQPCTLAIHVAQSTWAKSQAATPPMRIKASSRLHTPSRRITSQGVGGNSVLIDLIIEHSVSIWVASRQVE